MPKINPLICLGIPTWGRVTVHWARSYRHLGFPLGASMSEVLVEDKPIADARNEIMESALVNKVDFVFFLGDDVLPPGDAIIRLIHRMWANPDVHLATGVYWTKQWPTSPYLWQGMQRGPYLDWKVGEWFPVDYAGCDCLLVRLSPEIKALGPRWFDTDWRWTPAQEGPSSLATEDFYFYTRAREEQGLKLWVDTQVQCLHQDRESGLLFGLTNDMPQVGAPPPSLPEARTDDPDGKVVVADVGCGGDTPWFGPEDKVRLIRFDGNERVKPDYRCDLRQLPVPDRCVDLLWSRHTLEHFKAAEAVDVLKEWCRIIRVGGELRLCVPNIAWAMEHLLKVEKGEAEPDEYPWWQLYGRQEADHDCHFNGFTPKVLAQLVRRVPGLTDIEVEVKDDDRNLYVTARKKRHVSPLVLTERWQRLVEAGDAEMPGLNLDGTVKETTMAGDVAELAVAKDGEHVS